VSCHSLTTDRRVTLVGGDYTHGNTESTGRTSTLHIDIGVNWQWQP
jgi:hypothetical protein